MFREPLSFAGYRVVKAALDRPAGGQVSGGKSSSWTSVATGIPIALEDVSSLEQYSDQQIEGITTFDVLTRYRRDITEKMRLTFTNDTKAIVLDITGVNNVKMKNRWLILKCKSGVNRG